MRPFNSRLRLAVASALVALALLLATNAYASKHFARTCSVTGGSAQRLSAVLTTCGYSGSFFFREVGLRNPDAAANTLYYGQSDVNASNGVPLQPGDSYTWRSSAQDDANDAAQIYLFVSSTQNAEIATRAQ